MLKVAGQSLVHRQSIFSVSLNFHSVKFNESPTPFYKFRAVKTLFHAGLVVEPSGAAAFAALQANKIPDLSPGSNVVVMVTGGNVTPEELCDLLS